MADGAAVWGAGLWRDQGRLNYKVSEHIDRPWQPAKDLSSLGKSETRAELRLQSSVSVIPSLPV